MRSPGCFLARAAAAGQSMEKTGESEANVHLAGSTRNAWTGIQASRTKKRAKLQLEKDRLVQGPSSLQIADQLLAELARNEGLKGIERGTPEKKHLML